MTKIKIISMLLAFSFILLAAQKDSDEEIRKMHEEMITIDTHCDTPMKLLRGDFDLSEEHTPPDSRVDIPRMIKGGLDASFFAIFTSQRERTAENYQEAYTTAHKMIDSVYKAIEENQNYVKFGSTSEDVINNAKDGKRTIYMGMENGFPIGTELKRVKEFYDLGVRYITLAHTSNNDISDSSTDKKGPEHNGLSDFGKQVVQEMNRLGMMIDVSHISDDAFYDVLALSKTPVIASHSSVRALCNVPRNMSDEMIQALAQKGGVIQICILGAYVKEEDTTSLNFVKKQELRKKYNDYNFKTDEERKKAWEEWHQLNKDYPPVLPTIADAVDHIEHVIKLVGIDYVGIGSDFDGGGGLADCRDVSEYPAITKELYKRGYTKKEIAKIWGGNFLRVFKEVEKYALK